MPTNEERRECAKKLREIELVKLPDAGSELEEVHKAIGCWFGQDHFSQEFNDRLADLIEPEPERTCENLYKQRDKKGRIPVDNGVCFVCSECDAYVSDAESYHSGLYPSYNSNEFHYDIEFSYCPNCGAKVIDNDN